MKRSHAIHLALLALGALLFYWTLQAAGWDELAALMPEVKVWQLAALMLIYPVICSWDVAGWQLLFPASAARRVRFGGLYAVRLAGEALNALTPFVDIGGEFLKVHLAAGRFSIPRRAALASVVIQRTVLFFSEIAFWIFGLFLVRRSVQAPLEWESALYGVIIACAILAAGLWLLQRNGFFVSFIRLLRLVGMRPKFFDTFHLTFEEVDREIRHFYQGRSAQLLYSFALHFIGWVAGALEVWAMMRLIGRPVSFLEAVFIESLFQLVKTASFFIPGNFGAQEAGMALCMRWLGPGAAAGVAISLLKRLRQLVWIGAGLLIWWYFKWRLVRQARVIPDESRAFTTTAP